MIRLAPLALLSLSLFAGCGDKDDSGTDSGTDDSATTDDSAEEVAWADMDRDQRLAYMGGTVLPWAKETIEGVEGHNGTVTVTCGSCHGPDMEANDYAMPSSPVALDPNDMPPPEASALVGVMYTDVVGGMAGLIGQEPFDPSTGEGFGCFGCHPFAE